MFDSLRRSLSALPFDRIGKSPDVVLAICVSALVGLLIVPVPAPLLDVLLALNISIGALILVVSLLAPNALSVSTFPTILLLTTLFRLGLNVSTTRLILTTGHAGDVVTAFGHFVVQGDLIVGLVMFLVLTLVQFLVIAKGAERVAEVSARFTLDAMPGKQMSIDAALRAGAISEEEAQQKRTDLGRESQLFGSMDGAMKFVKGDAIAGLVITALNLVAGFIIGVARGGLSMDEAAQTYSILSIGDGLVSQIPALLITISSGILTTRVASRDGKTKLGTSIQLELLGSPQVLGIGGGLAVTIGLVPGLPTVPFMFIGLSLIGAAVAAHRREGRRAQGGDGRSDKQSAFQQKLEEKVKQAKAQRAMADNLAPSVVPIGIDLDPELSRRLGFGVGADQDHELLATLVPELRDALFFESGVRFPGVRVRSFVGSLPASTCVLRIKDVPIAQEHIPPGELLASESVERLTRLGVTGRATRDPAQGTAAAFVPESDRAHLEAAGVPLWTPAGIIALHLARVLRRHAVRFVGPQEVSEQLERLEKAYPALVKEVVPKLVSLQQLVEVLRRLVDEGVSIRDLKSILEALAEHAAFVNDGVELTELVRAALSLQICHAHAGLSARLPVVLLDALIEDTVRSAITPSRHGSCLALEPELTKAIVESAMRTLRPAFSAGLRPVILTSASLRRYVRTLLVDHIPGVSVLSFEELPAEVALQPVGRVCIRALAA